MTTLWAAGMRLTPARLRLASVPVEVVKAVDTSRTSTTSRTADPELTLPVVSGRTYKWGAILLVIAGNAAGDISVEVGYPSGSVGSWIGKGPHNSLPSASEEDGEWAYITHNSGTASAALPYGGGAAGTYVELSGRIVAAADGFLTINWAQFASNGTATTVKAGSHLWHQHINGS